MPDQAELAERTRNTLEALLRRATSGLPRVNRLTDLYNAVCVLHQSPVGGEDLARYGWSGPSAPNRSTPSPTARTSSSTRSRARWSGATTPG